MARYIDAEMLEKEIKIEASDSIARAVINVIDRQPTAEVEEVKYGKWLPQILLGQKVCDCSECKTLGSPHWKRCPICEAKMDGGKNND